MYPQPPSWVLGVRHHRRTDSRETAVKINGKKSFGAGLGGLAFAALMVMTAAPANAIPLPTDHPRITGAEEDFGYNWAINAPVNGGDLLWNVNAGLVTGRLQGYLYMKNAAGDCAKMQLLYHDASHNVLDIEESPVFNTGGSNGKRQFFVNEAGAGNALTTHVIVKLNVDHGCDGSWSTEGSQTWYA